MARYTYLRKRVPCVNRDTVGRGKGESWKLPEIDREGAAGSLSGY